MKRHYLSELSPWHIEDEKSQTDSKFLHKEFNVSKTKFTSIPKIRHQIHSQIKLQAKIPNANT